ncbi:MAG: hypothetical protein AMXMBFR58_30150 [Phycisphaerae bacterium]|nr:hypothetical protein [Phycisphaerales bacterium]MCK6476014.1 hypothetical protein [Phycisphaerales bacterium]
MPVPSALRLILRVFCVTAACVVLAGCDRRETLVTVESQREAMEILVELHDAKVLGGQVATEVRNRQDVHIISLPSSQLALGRTLLLQLDLPRAQRQGLETFVSSGGMIPTPADERAKLMHAISGELERTLEAISGIAHASVHVVLPAKDAFIGPVGGQEQAGKVTASVLLVVNKPPEGSATVLDVDALRGDAKKLVTKAVPDLAAENVEVVVSERATRPLLASQKDLGTYAAQLEKLARTLLFSAVGFGVAFIVTLLWGLLFRGPKSAPPAEDFAAA